ncbi:hypothetical protein [Herpetosiphon gulosus]|uniref:Ig-like domain-containing protein n=1 Tax=Herpetosiphon gulosus TaxID=1973496 RepID=A0ABP9XAM1_9CHLR
MSLHRVLARRIITLGMLLTLALVAAIPTASHAATPSTTVPTMGALAGCTVSASKPVRQGFTNTAGTWVSDGVVGTASVTGCPTNRTITVYVTIQRTNGSSYNGSYTCSNARYCSAWIGQPYVSGRWTTFGSSNQTGNTLAVSAYADL